ncbi:MAG TPA: nucleoside triphosphate pyrophosphohydrolase [Rhodanobacteraceae bacterium]|nr:nucleoside triphosphate pyrophosphohydrolase [Rhodanobacteraceae bacterium]
MDATPLPPIDRLRRIMQRLRDPERGCPWDIQQDFSSIAPYTLEEAYEVVDAIDRGDFDDLRDELGDLLFQVVFHARMAEEAGHFDFDEVAAAIADKLERRHPHVFGTAHYADVAEQTRAWEAIKASERRGRSEDGSALAGIARGLPEWRRALKLQQRAAAVGFDWPDPVPVLDKLTEELAEVRAEFAAGSAVERIEDEIGDMLFVLVNLCRHAKADFSGALRHANAKFERRFRIMEQLAADDGQVFAALPLAAQEALWRRAKQAEAGTQPT